MMLDEVEVAAGEMEAELDEVENKFEWFETGFWGTIPNHLSNEADALVGGELLVLFCVCVSMNEAPVPKRPLDEPIDALSEPEAARP
jgi:hypothetical protein